MFLGQAVAYLLSVIEICASFGKSFSLEVDFTSNKTNKKIFMLCFFLECLCVFLTTLYTVLELRNKSAIPLYALILASIFQVSSTIYEARDAYQLTKFVKEGNNYVLLQSAIKVTRPDAFKITFFTIFLCVLPVSILTFSESVIPQAKSMSCPACHDIDRCADELCQKCLPSELDFILFFSIPLLCILLAFLDWVSDGAFRPWRQLYIQPIIPFIGIGIIALYVAMILKLQKRLAPGIDTLLGLAWSHLFSLVFNTACVRPAKQILEYREDMVEDEDERKYLTYLKELPKGNLGEYGEDSLISGYFWTTIDPRTTPRTSTPNASAEKVHDTLESNGSMERTSSDDGLEKIGKVLLGGHLTFCRKLWEEVERIIKEYGGADKKEFEKAWDKMKASLGYVKPSFPKVIQPEGKIYPRSGVGPYYTILVTLRSLEKEQHVILQAQRQWKRVFPRKFNEHLTKDENISHCYTQVDTLLKERLEKLIENLKELEKVNKDYGNSSTVFDSLSSDEPDLQRCIGGLRRKFRSYYTKVEGVVRLTFQGGR